MSYHVLARKYRPRNFSEMVGQTAVLRALMNALNQNRLHHAYLFTGSRGVGKTSLARLFAKCLNCIERVDATPCESCEPCLSIASGRFADLIEIDAASRTRLEDTQELLNHVQYRPTMGRYKIYLIDEVHMLSTHSFNALLKTLEEPPPHIIFLLATTEPKRLPMTILSRCLQFHLRNFSIEQISQQLAHVLKQEGIDYETEALKPLAQAAEGSLRDALSLLEQAILYGKEGVKADEVYHLLGAIKESDQYELIAALIAGQVYHLMQLIQQLEEKAADFDQVLASLLTCLHQISLCQLYSAAGEAIEATDEIQQFAQQLDPESVQLYYQIALIGRRDLALSPSPRLGFEMTMLRMLSFQPVDIEDDKNRSEAPTALGHSDRNERKAEQPLPALMPEAKATINPACLNWTALIKQLLLKGVTKALAAHCVLESYDGEQMHLLLNAEQAALYNPRQERLLNEALNQYFKQSIRLVIQVSSLDQKTPAQLEAQHMRQRDAEVYQAVKKHPMVQELITRFDATIQPNSVHSYQEDLSHE